MAHFVLDHPQNLRDKGKEKIMVEPHRILAPHLEITISQRIGQICPKHIHYINSAMYTKSDLLLLHKLMY